MISSAVKRRIGYSLSYEGIAIICATTLLTLLGNDPIRSLPLSVGTSIIAILWNLVWNSIFEYTEKKLKWKGRPIDVRVLHAVGFEGGLTVICTPLLAWWLNLPLLTAFLTQIGLLAFFLFYTYVFNYSFDKMFGLPESAS